MASLRLMAGIPVLVAAAGCSVERLPPEDARDSEAIRGIVVAVHETFTAGDYPRLRTLFDSSAVIVWDNGGPQSLGDFETALAQWRSRLGESSMETRPLRLDVRHAGDAGTAWATSAWTISRPNGEVKNIEHRAVFLMTRADDGWRVLSLLLNRRDATPAS